MTRDFSLFAELSQVRGDCVLARRAERGEWLTPEQRSSLHQAAFGLAMTAHAEGAVKEFVSLAKFLEGGYQSDLKQTARETGAARISQAGVVIETSAVTVDKFEQQKQQLIQRARALGGVSSNSGGSAGSSGPDRRG